MPNATGTRGQLVGPKVIGGARTQLPIEISKPVTLDEMGVTDTQASKRQKAGRATISSI
jgi:hypothetical protein